MHRSIVSCLAMAALSSFAANALTNGGFESGLDGWTNDGAELSSESHEGERACRIRQAQPRWSGVSRILEIPVGAKNVAVSGWLRADSIRGGQNNWERGRLSVEFHDAKGDTVGGYPPAIGQVRGRQGWTRVSRSLAVPELARSLKIECALGNSTGTLHCDDLVVEFAP